MPRSTMAVAALDVDRQPVELGGQLAGALARRVGVMSLAGVFWRSRAAFCARGDRGGLGDRGRSDVVAGADEQARPGASVRPRPASLL